MNFNVWNIKEMLSTPTPTGPNKFSSQSSAPSDYSSLSDSQLLFGSQFCPENVQSAAAPLEQGMQLAQHGSKDVKPSIFSKYQAKPQLFDEDAKEKGWLSTFGSGRVKNVLEHFEANKNKIKDKYDREVLSTSISSIKDRIQELQACLDKFEETFDSRNKSILVHLETISKTLQDALQSHCDSVLKALTDKSQMEQALLEMERRLAAKDVEILEVKSSVQLLKEGLESLPAQLSNQHLKLCEELGFLKLPSILVELHTFISSAKMPPHTTDNSCQTSPGLCQNCVLGDENSHWLFCQGRRICSSLGRSQSPCMMVGEQQGDSSLRNQVTKGGTSTGVLNTASAACDREDTSLQVKYGLETQNCANHPCLYCTHSQFLGDSQKKTSSVPQQMPPPTPMPLPTPMRKAFRRGTQGLQHVTPSQQRQPQVCHLPVHKDMSGQRDWVTDSKSAAVENKAKERPGRIPWNKTVGRKRRCIARRKHKLPHCADSRLNQRKANGIMELESSRKNYFPRHMVALDLGSSDPLHAAASQQALSSAQQKLGEPFPQLADKKRRSLEMKERVNVSSVKRNIWDSSPQENVFPLCSTTGAKQMSCVTLRSPAASGRPSPVAVLAQQHTACCSLVLDSDYSD
ncbi:interactor of HORMAD1 protein 1 [Melanerpes formicivorus]|uniref:interactor of HORMAD1 protein 1 n=1 Tax=Melanerpes formicivorus TaxID=211600 RepID=UPI00358ED9E4